VFKGLRLRLTATYTLAALGLVLLAGMGTYGLLGYYFQSDNDAALRYRVALEYDSLGVPLPPDLAAAKANWVSRHGSTAVSTALPPGLARQDAGAGADDIETEGERGGPPWANYPDSELAALFVLRLGVDGSVVTSLSSAEEAAPTPVIESLQSARSRPDFRTVHLSDGSELRVATYHLTDSVMSDTQKVAYIQVGRMLTDQNHLLGDILIAVLLVCAGAAVVVGAASWYLAGRSLGPARRTWELQQTFVANASHELRAPVTLIRASAEYALKHSAGGGTLADKSVASGSPSVAGVLEDILTETDHLSRLVDDLLLLSRMDAGQLELDITSLPVNELLSGVGRSFARLAEGGGVTLVTNADDVAVRADATRLRQIVLILLDNALRHTPAGGTITLKAHADGQKVAISVVDTGSGIAAEDLPRVFDRFYSAGTPDGEGAGPGAGAGAGLGLAIAKAFMEKQKGKVVVTSCKGEGTQVTLYLPRGKT
jgi:signal transduction histidine kinase